MISYFYNYIIYNLNLFLNLFPIKRVYDLEKKKDITIKYYINNFLKKINLHDNKKYKRLGIYQKKYNEFYNNIYTISFFGIIIGYKYNYYNKIHRYLLYNKKLHKTDNIKNCNQYLNKEILQMKIKKKNKTMDISNASMNFYFNKEIIWNDFVIFYLLENKKKIYNWEYLTFKLLL